MRIKERRYGASPTITRRERRKKRGSTWSNCEENSDEDEGSKVEALKKERTLYMKNGRHMAPYFWDVYNCIRETAALMFTFKYNCN